MEGVDGRDRVEEHGARVTARNGKRMKVLVIDVGGSHVKILATGQTEARASSIPARR